MIVKETFDLATISILGVPIALCSVDELLSLVGTLIQSRSKGLVLSGNVHALNLSYELTWMKGLFHRAEAVRLDGAGVRLGAWILGQKTPTRMTWADFAWDLAEYAEPRGFSFFFLGARQGVADRAAAKLQQRFPRLRIVGVHHGYFDKTPGSADNEAVIAQINAVQPDILVVGFGMPLQERWLMENWDRIDARVALTGGAVFDYVSGELARAPGWMTNNGLEWLGRLLVEPRRLWRRYLVGNPLFLWRVLKQRLDLLTCDETGEFRDIG